MLDVFQATTRPSPRKRAQARPIEDRTTYPDGYEREMSEICEFEAFTAAVRRNRIE